MKGTAESDTEREREIQAGWNQESKKRQVFTEILVLCKSRISVRLVLRGGRNTRSLKVLQDCSMILFGLVHYMIVSTSLRFPRVAPSDCHGKPSSLLSDPLHAEHEHDNNIDSVLHPAHLAA